MFATVKKGIDDILKLLESTAHDRQQYRLCRRVLTDRYERGSILVTSNLPFSEWHQIFQGERMTAALLDRLTHRSHIFEMNGESYRFRESMKGKRAKAAGPAKN